MLYVYKGCNSKCTTIASYPLQGIPLYGNENSSGKEIAVGDAQTQAVDIYNYNSTAKTLKYSYSITNGLAGIQVGSGNFAPSNAWK